MLFDKAIDHSIGFTRARSSKHNSGPKGINDVYPTTVPFAFVVKP